MGVADRGGAALRAVFALALLFGVLGGCGGIWDPGLLAARHPALQRVGVQRLGDATPYLLPARGVLTLFLCRWETPRSIPVELPPDATQSERRLLIRALAAWEDAGLGVQFVPGPAGAAADGGIRIRFGERSDRRAAATAAECAVDPAERTPSQRDRLDARIVSASIALRRSEPDWLGRTVPYSEAQLLGSALHEIGHALGFQGHARRGDTVMVRSVQGVRRAGQQLLETGRFSDATLRALYAVPSGVVVARRALPPGRTRSFDLLAGLAAERGLTGPYVRVGDRAARIGWNRGAQAVYALYVDGLPEVLRRPAHLELIAGPEAADLPEARGGPRVPPGARLACAQSSPGSSSRAWACRASPASVLPSALSTIPSR